MNLKNSWSLLILFICYIPAFCQEVEKSYDQSSEATQPFLFSVKSLTSASKPWTVNYSGSYGERVSGAFGYDGIGQQFGINGYLGNRFSLYGKASFGFPRNGSISNAQQVELIRDFFGGEKSTGFHLGIGLGGSLDYSRTGAILGRIIPTYETDFWRLTGNLLFEKAFDDNRDAIDLTTSIGFQYQVLRNFYAGVEAVGEDLEGIWEEDEAEGGAKVLIGPSLNLAPANSRFSFSLAAGPLFYATHGRENPSEALRNLPDQNGFTLRAMVVFDLSGNSKS